jgi:uncharacterized glyoxalase superfamily protein PhnB
MAGATESGKGQAMNLKAKEIMAFVPSGKDYSQALAFYRDLGFEATWTSDELSVLKKDDCRFFLQNFAHEAMQKNFMMNLEVEDLDAWWRKIQEADLAGRYPGVRATEPRDYPWGKREIHLIDPAGVLWHIAVPSTGN